MATGPNSSPSPDLFVQLEADAVSAAPGTTITHRVAVTVDDVHSTPPAEGEYRIHLVDVGTGLSVLVQGADFNFLFDGGSSDDKRGISGSANNSRLLAYLWEAIGPSGPVGCQPGVRAEDTEEDPQRALQTVVLSHPHEDHGVFLDEVLNCYAVSDVYDSGVVNDRAFYGNFIAAVGQEPGVTYHTAVAPAADGIQTVRGTDHVIAGPWEQFTETTGVDDKVVLGAGASFRILHANGELHSDFNENSIVLRLDLGGTSLLLTGDAESGPREVPASPLGDIEEHLVAVHTDAINVDILQVGHHGSETSSRQEFLEAVSPRWALIGAGPRIFQGGVVLPDESVVQALATATGNASRVLRTDIRDEGGCQVADRIGSDGERPGGCDNYVLVIASSRRD